MDFTKEYASRHFTAHLQRRQQERKQISPNGNFSEESTERANADSVGQSDEGQELPVVDAAVGRRISKSKEKKFEWKDDMVEKLIDEWECQPLLFNVTHPQYHIKDKRRNCIMRIISNLQVSDMTPLPSYDDVQRKLNALRSYFVAEKNKTEHSKVSGSGANDIYKSKWQFYDRLSFLSDNITPRVTSCNLGKRPMTPQSTNDDVCYTYMPENAPSSKSARKMEIAKTNQLIESAVNILNKPRDRPPPMPEKEKTADQLFSEMICKLLENMEEGQSKDLLKMEIQRLIYEAKYSYGSRNQMALGNSGSNMLPGHSPWIQSTDTSMRPRISSALSSPLSQYSPSFPSERGSYSNGWEGEDCQQEL